MLMRDIRAAWEKLPIVALEVLLSGRRPLILAPHPDDESLGCGGLLAQCAAFRIPAQVAILTDGSRSHPGSLAYPPPRLAALRRREALVAITALGLSGGNLNWIGAPDTRLPSDGAEADRIIARLIDQCERAGSNLIVCAWRHDPHCDHEAAAALAARLARRLGLPVLSYPVWGWTLPDSVDLPTQKGYRLTIGREMSLKQKAIRSHATQYGGVISDSPDGFTLPAELLGVFERPYETFLIS